MKPVLTCASLVKSNNTGGSAPTSVLLSYSTHLHSESNGKELSFVIRDVASRHAVHRGMPYIAGNLLKFHVHWRKFPGVNLRKIAKHDGFHFVSCAK